MIGHRDLMDRIGFAVDPNRYADVYLWSDDPSSVGWVVSTRSSWDGVETFEVSTRREHLWLQITQFVVENYGSYLEPLHNVQPLSAWFVGRDNLVGIEIDFGDGTIASYPKQKNL